MPHRKEGYKFPISPPQNYKQFPKRTEMFSESVRGRRDRDDVAACTSADFVLRVHAKDAIFAQHNTREILEIIERPYSLVAKLKLAP